MNIFAKFGELILKLIDFIGILIINIPKIPQLIMNINTPRKSGIKWIPQRLKRM